MKTVAAPVALTLLALASAGAQPPPAESAAAPAADPQGITVVLERGSEVPIVGLAFPATPGLSTLPGTAANAGRELERTLRRDLERSGIFHILGPDDLGVLSLAGDLERDAEQYRSLGASMLLQNEIKLEGDRLVLEGRLIDLASRQPIVGKRYRGSFDLARRIAHTFADEIVLFLTSKRGIALTSIAFYSDRDGHKEVYLMDYDGHDQRR
jgi:Tol biopolymer transport system component